MLGGTVAEELQDALALLAYFSDPGSSPMGKLMDLSQRDELADRVNVRILECMAPSCAHTALQKLVRQVTVVSKELDDPIHPGPSFGLELELRVGRPGRGSARAGAQPEPQRPNVAFGGSTVADGL